MQYTGIRELTDLEIAQFYESNKIPDDVLMNQYLLIKDGKKVKDRYRWDGTNAIQIHKSQFKKYRDIDKPLDDIQLCAYDALFNPNINVVALVGKSGTGKTKTAISVGLELLHEGIYEKILLVRHAEESGESIGLLKGDKYTKLKDGYAGCFIDNIPGGDSFTFDDMVKNGDVELESVSLIKGRNLKRTFVIFDECEDAFPEHIELVGSRINDDAKLIFVGDYYQTSKVKYKNNSGLLYLINTAKGQDWFACVELQASGRGRIASFFANEFKDAYQNQKRRSDGVLESEISQ